MWGVASKTLSIGLGLTISLDPAVGDLLAEPNSRRRDVNSLKTSITLLNFSKAEFKSPASTDTVEGGGGGCRSWLKLNLDYIINLLNIP